jgi:hypothetical protein
VPLLEAQGLITVHPAQAEEQHSASDSEEEEQSPAITYTAKRCDVKLRPEDVVGRSVLETLLEKSHTCDLPACHEVRLLQYLLLLYHLDQLAVCVCYCAAM